MEPREHFGVMVRTVGLLVAITSAATAVGGFVFSWTQFVPFVQTAVLTFFIIVAAVQFLLGLSLIMWPNWLVAFAYPRSDPAKLAADQQR
jgi:hypothetical protein